MLLADNGVARETQAADQSTTTTFILTLKAQGMDQTIRQLRLLLKKALR